MRIETIRAWIFVGFGLLLIGALIYLLQVSKLATFVAVMGAIYRATLSALRRSEWRAPATRMSLSKPLKLWLVLRHGLL